MGLIRERALRIARIRRVRRSWNNGIAWHNHLTASHEFQVLDVLRDIRAVLTLILVALLLAQCSREPVEVQIVYTQPSANAEEAERHA